MGQACLSSVYPGQMPQNEESDQGIYCLPLIQHFLNTTTGSKMKVQGPVVQSMVSLTSLLMTNSLPVVAKVLGIFKYVDTFAAKM